jgi:WD40 repeat protein
VHPAAVTTLALHPDGRSLATGCKDNQARLFAILGEAGSLLWPPGPHYHKDGANPFREFCAPPMFANGGRELITYTEKTGLTWRAVATGAEVRTQDLHDWNGIIASITLSSNEQHLAVVGVQRSSVRLIEVATGRLVGPEFYHNNSVTCAAFSPDGRMLATSASDATVRLWAVPSGEPLAQPLDLRRSVLLVAFAPQGRSLATQDGDLVRLWVLPGEGVPMVRAPLDGQNSFAALSPDGAFAIPTGMTFSANRRLRSTRAYRVATGQAAGPPLRSAGFVVGAAFSPDGRSVAVLGEVTKQSTDAHELVIWNWASGRREWRAVLPSEPRSVSYRPDGQLLAVLCGGGDVVIFNPESGREARRWRAHDAEPARHWINNGKVSFSPDGRCVMTWGMGNDLRVWEADTGRLRYPPVRHRDKCHDVQFSPDGRLIALASYDRSVRVRDFATGSVVAELPNHPDIVFAACFSPDGQLLVTACRDRTVRVWDWRAGWLVCPPFEHTQEAVAAVFTPDGRWVFSGSADGTVRAWDWRTGKPITPPLPIGALFMGIAVTPARRHAVVAGLNNSLTVLDVSALATTAVDPAALCRWAELLAGQQLHEGGGTVNLSADEWLQRWRAYREQSPADTEVVFRDGNRPQPAADPAPIAADDDRFAP